MKNAQILFVLILTLVSGIHAQKSAKVLYEEIMTLDLELPDDLPQEVKDQIPNQRINNFDLIYDGEVALYTNSLSSPSSDIDVSSGDEDNQFQFKISAPKLTVYTDRGSGEFVSTQDFMGKAFLIVDRSRPNDWKITSEQKTVMDIPCIKATNDDGIVAWFAPSIKASHGPNGYGGLPGLILAMEYPENNREILAKAIKNHSVNPQDLEKPKKGKKVSRKQFDEIVEEKLAQMGAEGSGGMRIITIEEED